MKKILGIIVLSLLLSGNAYAKIITLENCYNKDRSSITFFQANLDKGSWRIKAKKGMTFVSTNGQINSNDTSSSSEIKQGKGIIRSTNLNYYNLLKKQFRSEAMKPLVGFYEVDIEKKRVSVYLDLVDADRKISASEVKIVQKTLGIDNNTWSKYAHYIFDYECKDYWVAGFKEPKKIETATTGSNDKLTQSKQICSDLGFQPKTEKFADCALKVMGIQFEATNKVASASGGTTQEVVVTHRNDYDIWDALLDFSAAIDPKNKTTTSSSPSNRGTSCVIGRTNSTFGTTTMNCN